MTFSSSPVTTLNHTISHFKYQSFLAGDDIVNLAVVLKDMRTKETFLAAEEFSISPPQITIQVQQHPPSCLCNSQSIIYELHSTVFLSLPSSSSSLLSFSWLSAEYDRIRLLLQWRTKSKSHQKSMHNNSLSNIVWWPKSNYLSHYDVSQLIICRPCRKRFSKEINFFCCSLTNYIHSLYTIY